MLAAVQSPGNVRREPSELHEVFSARVRRPLRRAGVSGEILWVGVPKRADHIRSGRRTRGRGVHDGNTRAFRQPKGNL